MAFPYVLHSTVGNSADQRRRGQVSQARAAYGLCRGDRTKWFGHHGTVQRPSVPSTKVPDGAKASRRPRWSLMLPALHRCPALSAQVTGKLACGSPAPFRALEKTITRCARARPIGPCRFRGTARRRARGVCFQRQFRGDHFVLMILDSIRNRIALSDAGRC